MAERASDGDEDDVVRIVRVALQGARIGTSVLAVGSVGGAIPARAAASADAFAFDCRAVAPRGRAGRSSRPLPDRPPRRPARATASPEGARRAPRSPRTCRSWPPRGSAGPWPAAGRARPPRRSRAISSARSTAASSVAAISTRATAAAAEHLPPGPARTRRSGSPRRPAPPPRDPGRRGPRPCRGRRRSGSAAAGRTAARRSRRPAACPASR